MKIAALKTPPLEETKYNKSMKVKEFIEILSELNSDLELTCVDTNGYSYTFQDLSETGEIWVKASDED